MRTSASQVSCQLPPLQEHTTITNSNISSGRFGFQVIPEFNPNNPFICLYMILVIYYNLVGMGMLSEDPL